MIPEQKRLRPEKNVIMQASEGHPLTGSPKISALINKNISPTKARKQNTIPIIDAHTRGADENATIPSIEY